MHICRRRKDKQAMRIQPEFILGLILGALLGAVLAILFAPMEGSQMRQQLLDQGIELRNRGGEAIDQVSQQVQQRSQEALAAATRPFADTKRGLARLWPW
jgi:gas vesicle protein